MEPAPMVSVITMYRSKGTDDISPDSYPGWQIFRVVDSDYFDWYFVARALALGWETRISDYYRHCWHNAENIPPDDINLCLL